MIPKAGCMYIDNYQTNPPLVFLIIKIEDEEDEYLFKIKTITGEKNMYSIGCTKIHVDELWSHYQFLMRN